MNEKVKITSHLEKDLSITHKHTKLRMSLDTVLKFFLSVVLFSQVRSKSGSEGGCKRREGEGEGENEKVNSVTFVNGTTFLNHMLFSLYSVTSSF